MKSLAENYKLADGDVWKQAKTDSVALEFLRAQELSPEKKCPRPDCITHDYERERKLEEENGSHS